MLTLNGVKWFCLAVKYAAGGWGILCVFMLVLIAFCSKGLISRRGYKEYEIRNITIYLMFHGLFGIFFYLLLPDYTTWAEWLGSR